MARILKDLLANDHPLFLMNIARLEQATGNGGVDIRLIGDIAEKANRTIRELGLDPANTTAHELYMALGALVRRDELRAKQLFSDTSYVLANFGSGPISFNIFDITENSHHDLPYDQRTVAHAQRKLRAELVRRYAERERMNAGSVHEVAREIGMMLEDDEPYSDIFDKTEENKAVNQPYILAIGDIITDDFIELDQNFAEMTTDDKGYKRISLELGAKIPYAGVETVRAVECSPNAAVSIQRLGLNAGLMSWIGDDGPGKEMTDYLKEQGVSTDEMVVEPGMKSNYHYVLRFGADRTKLQRFEDYAYEWRDPKVNPDWIYLGVLGEKTWPLHEAILDYLDRNPDIRMVFQPGMYHLMWGTEKMAPFYKHAEIVIMNREEAAQVTGRERADIHGLIDSLHELGVHVAVITDGADGAYASNGEQRLFMPNYPDPKPPLDRTGAGDAFASTIAAALMLGESLDTALKWAPINSMSVVQQMGAQAGLLSRDELQKYLSEAPDWYHPKEME